MANNNFSKHEVTVRRLADVVAGINEKFKIEEIGTTAVDLNDLVADDGKVHYYSWSNTNKGNVSNKPTDSVYTVQVLTCGSGSMGTYVLQTAYHRGDTSIYVRRRSDGATSWSSWTSTNNVYEFADNYDPSTNKGATVATVTNAVSALESQVTTALSGKANTSGSYPNIDAGTATHLNLYGEYVTWSSSSFDSDAPFAKIAEISWQMDSGKNNGAGQILQLEYSNKNVAKIRLNFITKGTNVERTLVKVIWSDFETQAELQDRIRVTYFTYNSGANFAIHVYVKFTGNWQVWRARQLDCQTGDEGYTNWVPMTFFTGSGSNIATPQGTLASYIFPVDTALSTTSENPVQNKVVASAIEGKAPTSHASSATTYGVGSSSSYGHVKLYDSVANENTDGAPTQNAVHDALGLKAPIDSPALTGTPTAPTAAASSNDTTIATTAFVKTAVSGVTVDDALIYKGTLAGGSSVSPGTLTPAANKGDTYKVVSRGMVDGIIVDSGTIIICNTDNTAAATSSNYGTIRSKWDFLQAALPICSNGSYVIDINGTASALAGGTSAYYQTNPLFVPVADNPPTGTTWSGLFDDAVNRLANGGRVYALVSGTKPGSSIVYEKQIPLSYIQGTRNNPYALMFIDVLDDMTNASASDKSRQGLIIRYTFSDSGWGTAEFNVGAAIVANQANKATADNNGNSLLLGFTNNQVSSIGNKNIRAVYADSSEYATSAGSATSATYDSSSRVISTYYSKKPILVDLGVDAEDPTKSHNLFTSSFLAADIPTPLSVPFTYSVAHDTSSYAVYNASVNFVGMEITDFVNYAIVRFQLRNTADTSESRWGAVVGLSNSIIVNEGASTFTISFIFRVTNADFRPKVYLEFMTGGANPEHVSGAVNGTHFFFTVPTA